MFDSKGDTNPETVEVKAVSAWTGSEGFVSRGQTVAVTPDRAEFLVYKGRARYEDSGVADVGAYAGAQGGGDADSRETASTAPAETTETKAPRRKPGRPRKSESGQEG